MNDLHKYLIGTAAGVVLCLLIWGGYFLIFDRNEINNISIAKLEPDGSALGTVSGQSSDVLGDNGFFISENGSDELTPEQQERLLAAQTANESLAKKYGDQDGNGVQNQQGFRNDQNTTETGSVYPGVFGNDALAINRGMQEQAAVQTTGNQKLEESRNTVRDYIVQGKNAAQKNQPANALTAFEHADEAMPDDKDFEAASYHDMASSLFLLSKTVPNAQTAQTVRDEAERYIKKSLAARNNADARELYSTIIAENRKEAEAKRQQTLLAQQQAADLVRKEEQVEQQRRQVVELIGQGKNAVNRRQLNDAVSAFDKAAAAMPDNKQFASDSYSEMADAMLSLAQHLSNPNDMNAALNKAESYIKEALAAQNSSNARNLYAKILDARKEQEQLAQARVEAQRKEQERLAQAKAEAQRKEQEQAAQAAAQKKEETQRKEQERLAQAKAEAQRKQQEQAAQAAAQKKKETQRKEQERLAQAKAEAQQKQQEQAAQAAVQKKEEAQRKQQELSKTAAHKQVETLIAQGIAAAQRKQLNNAILALDRASRLMPKDNDFAEEAYRKMADAMFNLAENSLDKQTKAGALKKADEYIKKALTAKNTPESQALATKITGAQSANQTNTAVKSQAVPKTTGTADSQQPPETADRQKNNGTAHDVNTTNTKTAAQARAAAEAEVAKKAQAELQAKKREVDALVQQGRKAAASNNFTEAQREFGKAAAQMPSGDAVFAAEQYREMADAMQSLAKTASAHKDQALKEAADYIKKSIAAKNDDAKAHYVYAQIADEQNNTTLAVQELEAARRFDPQNHQYNYELGRKYFEQKKYPQARACFEQAVKSNPQFEAAFFNLGMTHKIMNANDAALTAFSKAAALKPDYVRAWIEIARIQDKKRNYSESITDYRKALSLEPSNTSALKEMAQVYSKQKDANQAERYFKEALTLGDADSVTYYNLASVQLELGKTAEALQNAQKALAVNDKDARFLYTLGLALEKNNRLNEAETYYTRAIAADGQYGKPRINLGRIQLEAGHLDNAEQHLQAAYRVEPSNFEVNMNLGKLYGLKNQYGKAIDYYANAIKIMPKDTDARRNLAAVYLSAGLKENARDTYQALIKVNPQAWDSYYELGKVYISLDNKSEAKTIFEQLLRQNPNYRNAAEVRKLLSNL